MTEISVTVRRFVTKRQWDAEAREIPAVRVQAAMRLWIRVSPYAEMAPVIQAKIAQVALRIASVEPPAAPAAHVSKESVTAPATRSRKEPSVRIAGPATAVEMVSAREKKTTSIAPLIAPFQFAVTGSAITMKIGAIAPLTAATH